MGNMPDADLKLVVAEIRKIDPNGLCAVDLLRDTFDQLYDWPSTGRFRWEQLARIEKRGFGPIFEMNLQREFKFKDGVDVNIQISGIDVACVCSRTMGQWMIPPEAIMHICMLVWARDDVTPNWSMGFLRVFDNYLTSGEDGEGGTFLNKTGCDNIVWIFKDSNFPSNVVF